MIRVFEPSITYKDKISVFKALSRNNISGTSPIVKDFEESISENFDREYCVAVSNGSVALDIAFKVLDLKEKDEVILPSFTIISCLSAVIRSGASPVFCDVDENTWNMSLENVKEKITKNTKAVLMVHTYGLAAEAKKISKFCKDNKIYLIEDAAEAHGQNVEDVKCGSFGDISTFSFYANKHITTGEGGMILTNKEEYYNLAMRMRNLDFSKKRFLHDNLYWNYRMSSLQASLGISQIKNLKNVIKNKIDQGTYYLELLKNYEDCLQLPLKEYQNTVNHFWVFGIVLKKDNIRDLIISDLLEQGVETRPFFWPLNLQPSLPEKYLSKNSFPVSEYLGRNGLYIPIGNHIGKADQKKIVDLLIKTIEKRSTNA